MTSRLVADLCWKEVATRLELGAAVILPVGAAAKQHGLHLPMQADQIQAEYFSQVLAAILAPSQHGTPGTADDKGDALIWPTVNSGHYPAFTNYTGTLSLSSATFTALIAELTDQLYAISRGTLFIVDTGLSTGRCIGDAIARLAASDRVRHVPIYRGHRFKTVSTAVSEQVFGSHADEIETSIMLAIAPQFVRLTEAHKPPAVQRGGAPGPLSPNDNQSHNYSPSGSYGDPTLATVAKGHALVAAITEDLRATAMPPPGKAEE